MKKSTSKSLFFTFLLAFCIIIAGYFLSRGSGTQEPINGSQSLNQGGGEIESSQSTEIKGSIVYLTRDSKGSDIYTVSVNSQPQKVFTDKDEDLKIKSAQSLTLSGKILTEMASVDQQFGSSLYFIYTDGSGKKEKIVEEFASTQSPIISPNGKKIAYIVFSNAEADYGFSLYVMNNDGSNKQKITNDSSGLHILSWNPESNQLAFLKGNDPKQSIIYTADLKGDQAKELISFKEKVYSLDWEKQGFVFTKGPTEQEINKVEVFKMDSDGKNTKRLTNNETHENFCYFSQNGKTIGYLSVKYDNNIDNTKTGEINTIDLNGENGKKIAEGNYLIGWLNQ